MEEGNNMTRIISRGAFVGLAVAPLVALAACGSSGSGAGSSATTSATTSASSGNGQLAATVDVANNNLGPILVDQQGRTLYLFAKDSSTTSACTDACAVAWPPLRSDAQPTVAGGGTEPSLIGTTPRSDGNPQVTYNGHPLYLYKGDQKAGDANGQGVNAFGAAWYALSPAGDEITTGASSSGGNGY
jgi:predicted lipoprotein with Yx(FWY)xxD motif